MAHMRARTQNRRAGKPKVREQQLTEVRVDRLLFLFIVRHGHAAVAQRKPLHRRAILVIRGQRHQRRTHRNNGVPQLFRQPRAVAVRARAGVRSAAARQKHAGGLKHIVFRAHADDAAVFGQHLFHIALPNFHAALFQLLPKRVRNVVCIVRDREHAVAALRFQRHAKSLKKVHRVLRGEIVHRPVQKPAVAGRGFNHRARLAVVCYVAAALARNADLPPKLCVLF